MPKKKTSITIRDADMIKRLKYIGTTYKELYRAYPQYSQREIKKVCKSLGDTTICDGKSLLSEYIDKPEYEMLRSHLMTVPIDLLVNTGKVISQRTILWETKNTVNPNRDNFFEVVCEARDIMEYEDPLDKIDDDPEFQSLVSKWRDEHKPKLANCNGS